MLKIKPVRHFKRTVKASIPSETLLDKNEDVEFIAVFKALSRTEIEAIQAKAAAAEKPDDREFLRTILLGVEGVGDELGNPLPPTTARDAIIEDMTLCAAAVAVFNAQYATAKSGN